MYYFKSLPVLLGLCSHIASSEGFSIAQMSWFYITIVFPCLTYSTSIWRKYNVLAEWVDAVFTKLHVKGINLTTISVLFHMRDFWLNASVNALDALHCSWYDHNQKQNLVFGLARVPQGVLPGDAFKLSRGPFHSQSLSLIGAEGHSGCAAFSKRNK